MSKKFKNTVGTVLGVLVLAVSGYATTGNLDGVLSQFGITLPQEVKVLEKNSTGSKVATPSIKEDSNYTVSYGDFTPQIKQVGLRGDAKYPQTDSSLSKSNISYKIVNNPNNYTSSVVMKDVLDTKGDYLQAPVIEYKGNILEVPMYDGENRVKVVNNNKSDFTGEELSVNEPYKRISPQDDVLDTTNPNIKDPKKFQGRTLSNEVVVNREVLPSASRGGLKTEPTGWRQKTVNRKTHYDRGHVIAYSLSNEDDNPLNLTTQTINTNKHKGIFSFTYYEELVRDSVKKGNTIRYRVVPMYYEDELVPRAFQLEAKTVALAVNKEQGQHMDGKDKVYDVAEEIEFNVVVYNVQEGMSIDYSTGIMTEAE